MLLFGQRFQVTELGVAENLRALGVQVLGKPGQREARFLYSRVADLAREPFSASDQLELQVILVVVKQPRDGDAGRGVGHDAGDCRPA